MTAKKLSIGASIVALGACMAAAEATYATDPMGTNSGAAAQAQVGTQGAGANAQVGTPGTGTGANAQVGTPGANANVQVGTPGTATGQVKAQASVGAPMKGALTVKDPTLRTFVISGQDQVYVAPETVDIQQFQGQNVTVTFDPNGRVTSIQVDRDS
jgi:hypothetical protein